MMEDDLLERTQRRVFDGHAVGVEARIRAESETGIQGPEPYVAVWLGELRFGSDPGPVNYTFTTTQKVATLRGQTAAEVWAAAREASRLDGTDTVRLLWVRQDGTPSIAVSKLLGLAPDEPSA